MQGDSGFLQRFFFKNSFEFVCNLAEVFNRVVHRVRILQLAHFLGNASDSVRVGFCSQFHWFPPQSCTRYNAWAQNFFIKVQHKLPPETCLCERFWFPDYNSNLHLKAKASRLDNLHQPHDRRETLRQSPAATWADTFFCNLH